MAVQKLASTSGWQAYEGMNNVTQFILLSNVVGVKYPDPETTGVTLRLANGQFVQLSPSEPLSQVMNDLSIF